MGRRTINRRLTLVGTNGQPLLAPEVWGNWEALDPAVVREQLGIGVERVWRNERMMVFAHRLRSEIFRGPDNEPIELTHLAMVGTKQRPDVTWEEAWRAKGELLGENVEALELYPAADRTIHDLPERHLWAFPPDMKVPLGFAIRAAVVRPDEVGPDGQPVVQHLTPAQVEAEAQARPAADEAMAREAVGLPPAPALSEAEAMAAEQAAAAELANMRADLLRT